MNFAITIHGGRRTVNVIAANDERVLYNVGGQAEGGVSVNVSNCCMTRAGFEKRFSVNLDAA